MPYKDSVFTVNKIWFIDWRVIQSPQRHKSCFRRGTRVRTRRSLLIRKWLCALARQWHKIKHNFDFVAQCFALWDSHVTLSHSSEWHCPTPSPCHYEERSDVTISSTFFFVSLRGTKWRGNLAPLLFVTHNEIVKPTWQSLWIANTFPLSLINQILNHNILCLMDYKQFLTKSSNLL